MNTLSEYIYFYISENITSYTCIFVYTVYLVKPPLIKTKVAMFLNVLRKVE